LVEALSVRGELVAWQLQYDVIMQASGTSLSDAWQQLRALDPGARADLVRAQAVMKRLAGAGYRIDWLPLWPLPAEVAYRLKAAVRRLFPFLRT
jgi:hypothetical protein